VIFAHTGGVVWGIQSYNWEDWALPSTRHDIAMGCVDIFRGNVHNVSVVRSDITTGRGNAFDTWLFAATTTTPECSWRKVWMGHFRPSNRVHYCIQRIP